MRQFITSGSSFENDIGYSRAVVDGEWVFVSGTTGFDYLDAKDQTLATVLDVSSRGYSIWATPRIPLARGASWEVLARYDHWTPNRSGAIAPASATGRPGVPFTDQQQKRTIFGVSYWFPHEGNVSTAILVDYDGQRFDNITTAPTKGIAIHGLLNF